MQESKRKASINEGFHNPSREITPGQEKIEIVVVGARRSKSNGGGIPASRNLNERGIQHEPEKIVYIGDGMRETPNDWFTVVVKKLGDELMTV